jgi:conjugal transfer ATP-binding protein TraC
MKVFSQFGQKIAEWFGEETLFDRQHASASEQIELNFFSELLPYRLYDVQTGLYENQTSKGFVLEVVPLLKGSAEAERELSALIREIGEEGVNIQCLLFADPRVDQMMANWAKPRKQGLFATLAEKRESFFQRRDIDLPPRIFRFLFSYSQSQAHRGNIIEKKQKAIETFVRLSRVTSVEPEQLIEFLSGCINFDLTPATHQKSWEKHTFLSQQVCLPGAIEATRHGVILHNGAREAFVKTYEAIDLPEQWTLALSGELIGDFYNAAYRIPTPFLLHYGIHFPKQERMEMQFKSKKKVLEHQSKFPYASRMVPTIFQELEEHQQVGAFLKEGERFVETRLSFVLMADAEQLLQAESTWHALALKLGFVFKENHFIHLPDFLSCLPMAWGEETTMMTRLKRARCMRTTLTKETSIFIPCVAEWRGNSSTGMLLFGRRGQMATWDPFATEGNLNTIVVGPSGSGKSVFMQELLMSHLGQGGRVFVLDLGRSFEKLCHLLEGQYLSFSEKSQCNLNPFHLIRTESAELVNASLEMVSSIIATMAMPSHVIDKERSDLLTSLVRTAWEREGTQATVDTIIRLIDELTFHSELMIGASESLKEGLKKYSTQGVFAPFFYGKNSVSFTSPLVVIETEELKNMADLQAVILQIFTLTISSQIFMGDRSRRCLICIDEAWDLLKSPQMEGFIESLARRLRKYNGALVVGTQSIKDFDRSAGARAAFQNSNWLVMLGRDHESIGALKKEIALNEETETMLSSLRMESGKYSELGIYHKGTGACSVHQLRLDPFSALLYSTKADEYQAVMALKEQGASIEQAIDHLMTRSRLCSP